MRRVAVALRAQPPHVVLGVPEAATPKEVKDAFQKLAKVHHPDKGGDTEKFHSIRQAFETLSGTGDDAGAKPAQKTYNPADYEESLRRAASGRHARGRPEWAEEGTRFTDFESEQHHKNKRMIHSRFSLQLCTSLAFCTIVAYGIQYDEDEEGLSWIERPHPAVLAAISSQDKMSVEQRQQLETRINYSLRNVPGNSPIRQGKLPVAGIGHVDWEANKVVRSKAFESEIALKNKPKQVPRWKETRELSRVEMSRASPPVAPPGCAPNMGVQPSPDVVEARSRIAELEAELARLKEEPLPHRASA
eukprot:Rhum_TRINITY_DN13280_c0_g1::Rhum_TRINITY_DN13280_c0_g1_i1::g.58627::m.58627